MKKIYQNEDGTVSEEMLGDDLEIEADVEKLPL